MDNQYEFYINLTCNLMSNGETYEDAFKNLQSGWKDRVPELQWEDIDKVYEVTLNNKDNLLFSNISNYSIEKDHKELLKQIKDWEVELDRIISEAKDMTTSEIQDSLEDMSHEMFAINI